MDQVLALFAPAPDATAAVAADVACWRYVYEHYGPAFEGLSEADFVRLNLIIKCNGFASTDAATALPRALLFEQGSRFSHACRPNCHRLLLAGVLHVFALEALAPGTELTFAYLRPDKLLEPAPARQRYLAHYLFECDCPRCTTEAGDNVRCVACPACSALPPPTVVGAGCVWLPRSDPVAPMAVDGAPAAVPRCIVCKHALSAAEDAARVAAEAALAATLERLRSTPTNSAHLRRLLNEVRAAGLLDPGHFLVLPLHEELAKPYVMAPAALAALTAAELATRQRRRVLHALLRGAAAARALGPVPLPLAWILSDVATELVDIVTEAFPAHTERAATWTSLAATAEAMATALRWSWPAAAGQRDSTNEKQ